MSVQHDSLSGPGFGLCSCGAKCPAGEVISRWFDRHVLEERGAFKPPLGLKPRWLVTEQRFAEVQAAIQRYNEAGARVPYSWLVEQGELARFLSERGES